MFTKKLLTAVITSLLLSGYFVAAGLFTEGDPIFALFVLMYAGIGNILFGIPVSFLSDFATKTFAAYRLMAAGVIHILFGLVTVFVIEDLALFAVISAGLFFVIDEWINRKTRERKKLIASGLVITVVLILSIIAAWKIPPMVEEKTNHLFLVPEGFEGSIVVLYNVPNEPLLQKEDGYKRIPVKEEILDSLIGTDIQTYGLYQTSSPSAYGVINDKFYYVDDTGDRNPIEQYCTHYDGGGAYTGKNGLEIQYQTMQITNSKCSESFFLNGKDRYDRQTSEVLKNWLEFYDPAVGGEK